MHDFKVNVDQNLDTCGIGPCIGIAVFFDGRGSLLHSPDPRITAGIEFFAGLEGAIPALKRAEIRPVVCGGKLGKDIRGGAKEAKRVKQWVGEKLAQLGFGEPHFRWCPANEFAAQELSVDVTKGVVTVTTHLDLTSADAPKVETISVK